MGIYERTDTISAQVEHDPNVPIYGLTPSGEYGQISSGLTRADFAWPTQQPEDTYTIAAGEDVSIEFDSHFPIRPASLSWQVTESIGSEEIIERLFGTELREGLIEARDVGLVAVQFRLTVPQRREIAELQFRSPSTPTSISQACGEIALGKRFEEFHPDTVID